MTSTIFATRLTRRAVIGVAAASVFALAAGCGGGTSGAGGSGGDQAQTIKVGYIADYNGAGLMAVADQEGYWKQAGLVPKYVPFTNGPLAIQALGSGDVDVAYIGAGALWLPASGRAEIWALNSVSAADRVIAQPGITSLTQLKGKKIGVPRGTSGDILLSLALERDHLQRSDFNIVSMDPSTAVSAFASGQIQGAGLWYPLIATLKKSKPGLVELASDEDFVAHFTFPSSFVAKKGRAEQDKGLATSFDEVIKKANDYRYHHQDSTVAATAKFLKVDADQLRAQANYAKLYTTQQLEQETRSGKVDEWLTALQKQFVQAGTLKKVSDPKSFYMSKAYLDAPGG